jgi:hypothetical protein
MVSTWWRGWDLDPRPSGVSALVSAFEQVGVVLDRTRHVADVHDAVAGDVDHDNDRANGSGTGHEVSARHDP